MAWFGEDPVAALRRRVDDATTGSPTVAQRAALTGLIQQLKEVPGQAGRDAAREAEIVARMARLAPPARSGRLARIMHVVITESLDAAERPAGQV